MQNTAGGNWAWTGDGQRFLRAATEQTKDTEYGAAG